jgi:transposase-like protein
VEVFIVKKTRRRFSPEFKSEVVKLVVEHDRSVRDVCRELELVESAVRRWVHQAQIDGGKGPIGAVTSAEREELTQLRRDVKRLRMERDILKKATAFFVKENT